MSVNGGWGLSVGRITSAVRELESQKSEIAAECAALESKVRIRKDALMKVEEALKNVNGNLGELQAAESYMTTEAQSLRARCEELRRDEARLKQGLRKLDEQDREHQDSFFGKIQEINAHLAECNATYNRLHVQKQRQNLDFLLREKFGLCIPSVHRDHNPEQQTTLTKDELFQQCIDLASKREQSK
ncbi:hypothetical protein NDN08_002629 [Rhodosorus marinus]|uniref:Uncharacterized protein n=1 Tax=Rhodosorus marinus TaxID=101924 RepID=A0AAV8UYN4_9RHOD|nr:hypothetical protein NDN08_002629 [Rhodosorus marinus]